MCCAGPLCVRVSERSKAGSAVKCQWMKGLFLCAEPSDVPVKSEVSTSAKSCSFEERMKGMSQGH